jgi:hypothetical protein
MDPGNFRQQLIDETVQDSTTIPTSDSIKPDFPSANPEDSEKSPKVTFPQIGTPHYPEATQNTAVAASHDTIGSPPRLWEIDSALNNTRFYKMWFLLFNVLTMIFMLINVLILAISTKANLLVLCACYGGLIGGISFGIASLGNQGVVDKSLPKIVQRRKAIIGLAITQAIWAILATILLSEHKGDGGAIASVWILLLFQVVIYYLMNLNNEKLAKLLKEREGLLMSITNFIQP